jgi:hypothetical protein
MWITYLQWEARPVWPTTCHWLEELLVLAMVEMQLLELQA